MIIITIDKLYFMDGIYRVTANIEKALHPDVPDYVTSVDIITLKETRVTITTKIEERLIQYACDKAVREYWEATCRRATVGYLNVTRTPQHIYPDYREAIEGVEGVYLTD